MSQGPARWLPLLTLLFFGSGAAALVYEIVWLQMLELFVGSSAVSIGILLGTFMGGMCLGSLLVPRLIAARRHPLRVYAALEAAIAALGLTLLLVMPLAGRVYTAWGGYGLRGFLLRGLVAAVCLLPPTMAMGGTLPAVARFVESTPWGLSWLGVFYAGNIAGAVFGCLLAGFYLLPVHDMVTATYVAAAVNVEVAALALLLASATGARAAGGGAPARADVARAPTGARGAHAVAYAAIAISGFCALAAEVVWTRLLALLLGATVYTFAIILAVFLLGLGLGSAAGAMAARAVARPLLALGACQLGVVGGVAWSAAMLTRSLPYWPINVSLSKSVWLTFQLDLARTAWALLPAPVFWGASFPLALAAVAGAGRDPGRLVGRVYAANTLGAIFGALGASLVLLGGIGSRGSQQVILGAAALGALLTFLPSLAPAGAGWRAPRRVGQALGVLAGLVLVAALIAGVAPVPGILVAYGRYAATWLGQAGQMLYIGEGLNASVAVSRAANGLVHYHSAGKVQASSAPSDMRLQRMLGHLTTLVPKDPRSVLVIGCGAGVTAGAVSVDPRVARVTIAEIEPLVPRHVAPYFAGVNHDVVRSPKVRVVLDDARHYLLTSRQSYDAITSDPLDPWVKGAATLYTREFFETARAHLNPGGVVTLFVQLYESSPEAVKSEVATFFEVFPRGVVWANTQRGRGYDMVLLGQSPAAPIDLDALSARLQDPAFAEVRRSLGEIGVATAVDLLSTFAGRAEDLAPWLAGASINRDRDLRLQYLAGLGLNQYQSDRIYADMVRYRRFPDDLFTGSETRRQALRAAIERPGR